MCIFSHPERFLLLLVKKVWGHSCSTIRGMENAYRPSLTMSIRSLFRKRRSSVSYEEAFLLDISLSTLLQLPITVKQQWCDAVSTAKDHFERRSQSELKEMQRFIERWRGRLRRQTAWLHFYWGYLLQWSNYPEITENLNQHVERLRVVPSGRL